MIASRQVLTSASEGLRGTGEAANGGGTSAAGNASGGASITSTATVTKPRPKMPKERCCSAFFGIRERHCVAAAGQKAPYDVWIAPIHHVSSRPSAVGQLARLQLSEQPLWRPAERAGRAPCRTDVASRCGHVGSPLEIRCNSCT